MSIDLQAINLSVSVDGKPVIKAFTHLFQAGSVTLILGRSGSGKTMLLEALSGLREIEQGDIIVGDSPLWQGQTRRKLQRQTMLLSGIGFQHPEQQLFAQTIEAEFQYNLRPYQLSVEQQKERIQAAASLIDNESDNWLRSDPFKLSGGQKRRLTLAVLEATAPEWLLLDEPTSGVDATGIMQLNQQLKQRRALGKGTIVITHDLEGLIEVADHLVLMKEGEIYWRGKPSKLLAEPQHLEAAGLALPAHMITQQLLQRAGFSFPDGWPDARNTAKAIVGQLANKTIKPISDGSKIELDKFAEVKQEKRLNRLQAFDPRAVWLMYILLSSGILLQSSWYGWAISGLVAMGVIRFAGVPYKVWSRPAKGLIVFALIAAMLSGISLGAADQSFDNIHDANGPVWQLSPSIHFAAGAAEFTFYHFSRLVMIMLIGFVLLANMNPLLLKRALEQSLYRLHHIRLPIEQFALIAALMIRFLPLLMNEWDRFARIAAARGKYAVRPGRIPFRNMRMAIIPFLMSLIRLGEEMSLILIMRGIGLAGRKETRLFRLTFHKSDYRLILIALSLLVGLLLVSRLS